MASAKDKVESALNESRMLILGAQILLGFQYEAAFTSTFKELPPSSQQLAVFELGLLLMAITLLMSPVSYDHLVCHCESPVRLDSFATGVMKAALLPFAVAIGVGLYVVTQRLGYVLALAVSVSFTLLALGFWYGLGLVARARKAPVQKTVHMQKDRAAAVALNVKTRNALTEARMVLPGAQALLGFQTVSMLSQEFGKLPASSQYIHLVSLLTIALATILLMTPAAYDRIVHQGEHTESFHRVASTFVIAAMVPLGAGIAGDLFVVIRIVTGSVLAGIVGGAAALLFMYGVWFGYTLYQRRANERGQNERIGAETA